MIKRRKSSAGGRGTKRGAAKKKPIVAANGDRIRLRWLKSDEGRRVFRRARGGTYKQVWPALPRRRRKRRKN